MTTGGTLAIMLPLLGFILGVLRLVVQLADSRLTELNDRLCDLDLRLAELARHLDRAVAGLAMPTRAGQRDEIAAPGTFAKHPVGRHEERLGDIAGP
jgi:hypothetical protein